MARLSHRRLVQAGVAATLVAIVFAFGYLATRGKPAPPIPPTEKLRIALPMVPHAALLHIAAAKGYFADEGLAVTLIPTIHGGAAIDLVVQGNADIGAASDVVFVLSAAKAGGLAIAASIVSFSNDVAVIARSDRAIAVPRDLVGKRIGVTLGTASDYFLWTFLVRQKLTSGAVTLVDMPPGRMAPELAAGTIDAVSTWQPNVNDAQLALRDNAVAFCEPLIYTGTFNLIGRLDFLAGHSSAIEKLVRAVAKAEQFNSAQPDAAMDLVAERLHIDAQSLLPAWKELTFKVNLRQSQLITMEDEARWAMTTGQIAKGPIPNYLPNLYLDALLAVQPKSVTVIR
jgi:NitT/TauT family transport system substrate-binding protein